METFGTEPHAGQRKNGLEDRLAEIERKVTSTARSIDPSKYLESPWVRVGLAVAVGFAAGMSRDSAVMRTGVRLVLTAGARYLIKDALDKA